jgi:hypothetical protein
MTYFVVHPIVGGGAFDAPKKRTPEDGCPYDSAIPAQNNAHLPYRYCVGGGVPPPYGIPLGALEKIWENMQKSKKILAIPQKIV